MDNIKIRIFVRVCLTSQSFYGIITKMGSCSVIGCSLPYVSGVKKLPDRSFSLGESNR